MTQTNVLPSDRVALNMLQDLELSDDGYSLRTPCDGDVDYEGRHIVVGGETVIIFMYSAEGEKTRDAMLALINAARHREQSVKELREALDCAERDLTATYEVAKAGKVAIVSIGQFQRLDRIRAALASAGGRP